MTISSLPLSYCTNVHPARTVQELISGVQEHSGTARQMLELPMAAGLWFPASVAEELMEQSESLELLAQVLWESDLACYTLNAFPYGDFHSERVKEQVYLPDWTSTERFRYTEHCAQLLAKLLPENAEGSISTVPLGGRMNPGSSSQTFHAVCFAQLIRFAEVLKQIYETTGRRIRLAIEPEPWCELDRTEETTVPIFERLFEMAEARNCEAQVREYIGLCFDVCHQAVVFENVCRSIDQIEDSGIRINKVHITNAVELLNPSKNPEGLRELRKYVEPRYLHQVYARFRDGRIEHRVDLTADQLAETRSEPFQSAESWRVHFHVPVNQETLGPLKTTRPDLCAALRRVRTLTYSPHLEVETYTWPVMPSESPGAGLGDRISLSSGKSSLTNDKAIAGTLAARIVSELSSTYEILKETDFT
ncbi:MAG: metabolite traffic protein EboE [Planctomyces sp.]